MLRTPLYRTYQFVMKVAANFLGINEPQLLSGVNSIKMALKLIKSAGLSHPLVVTDNGLNKIGLLSPLFKACEEEKLNYSYFYNIDANPTIRSVNEGVSFYLNEGCDSIIVVGGGSAIDAAKLIGALVTNPNKSVEDLRGLLKIKKALPFLVAIPTTAGTGSETTLAAVIVNELNHHKYAINDPHLIPKYAILDPSFLLGLPKEVTSTTGMDALTHAVEAFIGNSNTKKTKQAALDAIKLIYENLYSSYKDGKNLEYRENMQKGAYYAGVAFTRAYVGYVHAIAHSFGGKYNVAHGLANAMILPHVLEAYGKKIYKKLAIISDYISLCEKSKTDKEKAEAFISWIRRMNESMNIPEKFEYSYDIRDVDEMIDNAFKEGNPLYPVPKEFNREDFRKIYRLVLK